MAPKSEEVPTATASKDEKKPKKLTKEELEKKKEEDELSDEDKQLKEELELCVTRLSEFPHYFSHQFSQFSPPAETDEKLWSPALTSMTTLIRASTTSMTSVPKPLKFLRPHYDTMKTVIINY